MSIKHITKQNFKEEVLEKEGTCLLYTSPQPFSVININRIDVSLPEFS